MTESSANARHEGDEVESRISVTDRPRPPLALDFCVPTRSAPIDGRPAAQMQTAIRSAASSGVLNCLGAAYAYLMVFLLSRRAFGATCYSAPVRVPVVFRPRPSWPLANRRPTIHERLRAVGSHSLTCVGGGGVRWSQSESPCLGPRVAPPLITPHATATRVAAAASTTRFCSAARRGHWRAAAAPTAGTRAVSPVLQQQPHPCPRAVSPVASAASTSAPACSSDAQRRRGESRQPRQNKGLAGG